MIKKQLPNMLSTRLSELSCNRKEFEKAATPYDIAIKTSGYHEQLAYDDHATDTRARKRNRKRNVVWFNPPFSESVKNNIGIEFLKLVDKHFPPHHHLLKVCNRNTLKVSYICMPNMATIISSHNKNLLGNKQEPKATIPPCNCRYSANCPLNGECRKKAVIYKASITSDGSSKHYAGCTEKRNSRPVITITPTPSDIERKEMRQNSQKHFGMLKILAMNLQSNGLLLIEPLLTNPGPDPTIYA